MNNIPENTGNSLVTDLESLREVKSSTCLLLPTTPSPISLHFKHPLSEETNEEEAFLSLNGETNMQNSDALGGDSSSSADSNSVVQDPVSAQLINNISMLDYQTLSKNGDIIIGQADDCKLKGNLKLSNRKLPNFVNWNWGLIRKILLWIGLSGLVAFLGAIIAMIVTIPKLCNPDQPWYQGKVFYEVSPNSVGDLKGIIKKLDYIQQLGVSAVHLNYIFELHSVDYNRMSLMNIDPEIGNLQDVQDLVKAVHYKNMSLILDLPVVSLSSLSVHLNSTPSVLFTNDTQILTSEFDATTSAIVYWSRVYNVDGFYLKNLEKFVDDANFGKSMQFWKNIVGINKIFIVSSEAYSKAQGDSLNVLLSRADLIDFHLDLSKGVRDVKMYIEKVLDSSLWSKPYYPWIHWNIENTNNDTLRMDSLRNVLVLTALEFALPGTVSISFDKNADSRGLVDKNNTSLFLNEGLNKTSIITSDNNFFKLSSDVTEVIKSLIHLKSVTPTLYLRAIYKEGNIFKNTGIRKTGDSLIMLERWYPRRNTCVFVGNFDNKSVTTDLSSMFYGGTVVMSTNMSLMGQVLYFDNVTFPPNSAVILKLEK